MKKINQEQSAENINLNIKSKKEDTLVSASIEDGKRVDAAFAKQKNVVPSLQHLIP